MFARSLETIEGWDELKGVSGSYQDTRRSLARENGILSSLEEAIRLSGLKNGMTVSFHHHFRDGDRVVNMVMTKLAEMGFKDLVVAASSLSSCHAPLIDLVKQGVIRRFETSGLRGKLAEAISAGLMDIPVVFRSHGGRAYAIESGQLPIDVAFIGAPSCDNCGYVNGYSREGDNSIMCGSLGYAMCDAQYARKTIALTSNLVPYPNVPRAIPATNVDYVVVVPEIGDPAGIMSGATRYTKNPKELLIAEQAAQVIKNSGLFVDGFSMQMGSGGASLAVTRFLREMMLKEHISAGFGLGGITGSMVALHEEGLVRKLLDVQSFDLVAAESLKNNRFHQQISASSYASPGQPHAAVNQLDIVVLSALEIDTDFNVNVLTGSDGTIRGAIGGHQDTAAGAKMTVVVCPLTRGRIASVVDKVDTIVTPGADVNVLVTDYGVAVNPADGELCDRLKKAGLPIHSIAEFRDRARQMLGVPAPVRHGSKVVGIVTYRDGSVIDLINQVEE